MTIPYYQAARFPGKAKAEDVYYPLQRIIQSAKNDCDLSIYRFKSKKAGWIVAVIGEQPGAALHQYIEADLANGELITLDEETLNFLKQRRDQATQFGPWVERHYNHEETE